MHKDKVKEKISTKNITLIVFILCILMYVVDVYFKVNYFYKSFIKLIMFLGFPVLYCLKDKNINLKDYFKINSLKQLFYSLLLGIIIYIFIIIAYLIARNFIDLNSIAITLGDSLNVNKNNFIFVSIYISFINSLLEEFFFRGFAFLSLRKLSSRGFSYFFSALAFSLYHIAIILNWFNIFVFIIILIGLVIAGVIFNFVNEKSQNIYNSWLIHMFANFAINSIGFYMFTL
ncbi:CAAX amino terminal protease self-immunity [uncultured Clostridium sp.]|uniref:CPBP family intramembrane glutamic endopeptidase n=1 Tax=uncultured Clostridium sp. TaxID=59620 RepID=UPI0008226621|nr:CPBP family intramembrane glutamic endopeptidase [uncultured Clostridium sp.]SCJ62140.1 CAAX amino terminal protease self-immunity [uncultured Clostridium sp.]